MASKIFAYSDCKTNRLGSGFGNCDQIDLDDIIGFTLFEKGWSIDITDGEIALDVASYKNDIKALKAFPYVGLYEFTQDTPENETATSSSNVISEVRVGKPQFGFNFDKGTEFHKSLWNKRAPNGGLWDFALVTKTHIIFATNSDETKLVAFDGGMFGVETFKFKQGGDPQSSMNKMQFLDAFQFNERILPLSYEKVGDLNKVDGVRDTQINIDPISSGTTFSASIVSLWNRDTSILDLEDATNFVLLGTQASATAIDTVVYNASTNKYDFTLTVAVSAADTVQIKLSDGTYDVVEDTLGNLYKGTSNSETVS